LPSPYFPNPSGFGANEYPLPPGANITQVHLIHRHGSRYPTGESSVPTFASKIQNITRNGTATFSGALSFLNTWSYKLGWEILVPTGRQELFDSGVLFYYNYGQLYDPSTKIIARTTTQDRMLKSAEYFMAGFFGLEWTNNATLEPIVEGPGFNNSLAGYFQCSNANQSLSMGGTNASIIWEQKYLIDSTDRFSALVEGYNWTTADTYNMQTLCPYETIALGYSSFCQLFSFPEWEGFEYSIDLSFAGNNAFGSPTGRAVGIGYVEEVYARLRHHLYDLPGSATQVNTTLDEMEETFPLNQALYFDFSHDTNIMSVITAFGLRQFNQTLSPTRPPPDQQLIVSLMTPFAARFVIEVIRTPHPLKATRPNSVDTSTEDFYDTTAGGDTTYVHMTLSQRTIPLFKSYPQCEERDDGWCEMSAFMDVLSGLLEAAKYEYSCFGDYGVQNVTDGAPLRRRDEAVKKGFVLGRGMGSGLEAPGRRSSDAWRA
jgi:Histidine phosphatase superfamily (branch 2)